MPITYARGINGAIGTLVGIAGATPFNFKSEQWRIQLNQDLDDVSGFGDGGNSYWSPGKSMWNVQITGFILTGTNGTVGHNNLVGTQNILTTGSFTMDGGRSCWGSVRIYQVTDSVVYQNNGGFVGIAALGRGEGPLNES